MKCSCVKSIPIALLLVLFQGCGIIYPPSRIYQEVNIASEGEAILWNPGINIEFLDGQTVKNLVDSEIHLVELYRLNPGTHILEVISKEDEESHPVDGTALIEKSWNEVQTSMMINFETGHSYYFYVEYDDDARGRARFYIRDLGTGVSSSELPILPTDIWLPSSIEEFRNQNEPFYQSMKRSGAQVELLPAPLTARK